MTFSPNDIVNLLYGITGLGVGILFIFYNKLFANGSIAQDIFFWKDLSPLSVKTCKSRPFFIFTRVILYIIGIFTFFIGIRIIFNLSVP